MTAPDDDDFPIAESQAELAEALHWLADQLPATDFPIAEMTKDELAQAAEKLDRLTEYGAQLTDKMIGLYCPTVIARCAEMLDELDAHSVELRRCAKRFDPHVE